MQHSTACRKATTRRPAAALLCSALHTTIVHTGAGAGGRGAGQGRELRALRSPASESRCSRRRSPGGKHIGCLCHAGGHWCRCQKSSASFAWGCSVFYMHVLDSVASKGTARKERVVERCNGRKLNRVLERLASILRRLSVIGWRYHDQYAKAPRSDKQITSLGNIASINAWSTMLGTCLCRRQGI